MEKDKQADGAVRVREILYYMFFSLLFFAKGIGLYDGQGLFKVFLVLAFACFVLKMVTTDYTLRELAFLAVLAAMALLSYAGTKEKGIMFTLAIVAGLKKVPVKRVFGVALAVWGVSFLPAVAATTLGWADSPFRVHVRPFLGFVIRWGLGSAHPNVGHIAYLVFTVLTVYVLGEKVSWKWLAGLFAGNLYIYFYTMSQTGLLMTSFYLAAAGYLMLRRKPSRAEYGLVECVLPACILASLVLPLVLKGKAFDILNKLMNTRVMQSKEYLTQEKITWFGSLPKRSNAINTMDNSYLFAFLTYGAVTFAVLMAAYFLLVRKYVLQKRNRELALIVTLLLAGLSEPFLFNTSFKNVSLLFMGELLFPAREPGEGIWEKEIRLWGIGDRRVALPFGGISLWWERVKTCKREYRVQVLAGTVLAAAVWAGAYGLAAHAPARIVVPRKLCDSVEQESVYFARGEEPADSLVLGYVDEETPMVAFTGSLARMEYVRGILCRAVYGAGLGFVVVLGGYYVVKYKDSKG